MNQRENYCIICNTTENLKPLQIEHKHLDPQNTHSICYKCLMDSVSGKTPPLREQLFGEKE